MPEETKTIQGEGKEAKREEEEEETEKGEWEEMTNAHIAEFLKALARCYKVTWEPEKPRKDEFNVNRQECEY